MYIILRSTRIPLVDKDKSVRVFATRKEAEFSISSYPQLIVQEGREYARSRAECLK